MNVNFRSSKRIVVAEMVSHMQRNVEEEEWDQEQYDKWLQEGEAPMFGKLQDATVHIKRAVIGHVAKDVNILVKSANNGKKAFAYVKTENGPVVLMRGRTGGTH